MRGIALLALLVSLPAAAQERAERRRGALLAAPKMGLFQATSRLGGALYLGAEVGYVAPLPLGALAAIVELDWYRPVARGAVSDPRLTVGGASASGSYDLAQSEIGLLLSAAYRAEGLLGAGLVPFAGGGPGLYWHRASITAFGSTNVETATKLGFQIFGGADYRLGPGSVFAEVRYHFARVDFRSTGDANVGGFLALGAGYRLRIF